jgi:hypothetical protein
MQYIACALNSLARLLEKPKVQLPPKNDMIDRSEGFEKPSQEQTDSDMQMLP